MRLTLLSLLIAAGLFASCNDNNNQNTDKATTTATPPAPPKEPVSDLTKPQTDELMNMLSAYYGLKDALVATNGAGADAAASKLLSTAELFRNGLGDQPQYTEMQPQVKTIMTESDAIVNAKGAGDAVVEAKRQHFAPVSEAMFKVLKMANLKNGGVYQQFCPMAFDNKGATWLSNAEEIKNPYLPKTMLECGEVRDSL
jgi:Cu(I)/Ag(I) efflux system membrane fusion protein